MHKFEGFEVDTQLENRGPGMVYCTMCTSLLIHRPTCCQQSRQRWKRTYRVHHMSTTMVELTGSMKTSLGYPAFQI